MLFRKPYRKIVPAAIRKKIFLYLKSYIRQEIRKKTNNIVVSGPFEGMRIDIDDNTLEMFLLGTLELEIHPAFAELSAFRFDQIINIGATEGYYAVGMALKWPQATVYAFENQEDYWRPKILKLASDNLVADRVHIQGHCSSSELVDLLKPDKSTLLMLDVEGDEIKLLDLLLVNGLLRATILVELHDMFVPECSRIIEERFKNTHDISKYVTRSRTINDFPLRGWNFINPLIGPFVVAAMWERTDTQEFYLMIPKNCSAESEDIK